MMMRFLQGSLVILTSLMLVACNTEGDGEASANVTLDKSTAESMESYASLGVSIAQDATVVTDNNRSASRSIQSRSSFASCISVDSSGTSSSGSLTIEYNNCSDTGIAINGSITVTWDDSGSVVTYTETGDLEMQVTSDGQTVKVALRDMDFSITDNGTTVTASSDFVLRFEAGDQVGEFTFETLEDLTYPTGDDDASQVNGKMRITDHLGNSFTITYVDGTATVQ